VVSEGLRLPGRETPGRCARMAPGSQFFADAPHSMHAPRSARNRSSPFRDARRGFLAFRKRSADTSTRHATRIARSMSPGGPPEWYSISCDDEMKTRLGTTVDVLKAMAHPVRLRMLSMLRGGELCVCQITAALELAASTVSAHLADLKRAGLVEERRVGRWVFHRLAEDEAAARPFEPLWKAIGDDPQLAADARLLRDLRRVPVEELCRVDLDLRRVGIRRRPPATANRQEEVRR